MGSCWNLDSLLGGSKAFLPLGGYLVLNFLVDFPTQKDKETTKCDFFFAKEAEGLRLEGRPAEALVCSLYL